MAAETQHTYDEASIRHLDDIEHIRRRPGMYIGRLGNGDNQGDGIYVLIKEIVDNSIDEYSMGYGKQILIDIVDRQVTVRDFGRGIPLGSVVVVTSQLNTGGKFDPVVLVSGTVFPRREDGLGRIQGRQAHRLGRKHHPREERHAGGLHARYADVRGLPLQDGVCRDPDQELLLPQERTGPGAEGGYL